METTSQPKHIGRNISRLRELRGMKQEALAQALGVSQQAVSILENSQEVDESRLRDVAKALGTSIEAVKNFTEEAVINYITNFYDNSHGNGVNQGTCNFNPLDKLIEAYEENKKLYERLIEELKKK